MPTNFTYTEDCNKSDCAPGSYRSTYRKYTELSSHSETPTHAVFAVYSIYPNQHPPCRATTGTTTRAFQGSASPQQGSLSFEMTDHPQIHLLGRGSQEKRPPCTGRNKPCPLTDSRGSLGPAWFVELQKGRYTIPELPQATLR